MGVEVYAITFAALPLEVDFENFNRAQGMIRESKFTLEELRKHGFSYNRELADTLSSLDEKVLEDLFNAADKCFAEENP